MRRGMSTDLDTDRDCLTGYAYRALYDWDQYFEAIIQIYMVWTLLAHFLPCEQDRELGITNPAPSHQPIA